MRNRKRSTTSFAIVFGSFESVFFGLLSSSSLIFLTENGLTITNLF